MPSSCANSVTFCTGRGVRQFPPGPRALARFSCAPNRASRWLGGVAGPRDFWKTDSVSNFPSSAVHSTISTVDRISPSEAGRRQRLSQFAEPLFLARWDRAVFINYSADPDVLQPEVPFKLDLHDGRAFVSVVAFTLVRMRPRIGGRWTEWLLKSIATHEFL